MANIMYANPFGNFVEGEQRGLDTAVRAGQAARQFRAEDLSPQVQKWYLPLVQREAETRARTGELGLNEQLTGFTGKLAALGPSGRGAFYNALNSMGIPVSDQDFPNSQQAYERIGAASGNVPYAFGIPNVAVAGSHYTSRDISPLYNMPQQNDELAQLKRQLELEQTRQQLEKMRNPQSNNIFGAAFNFLNPQSTPSVNQTSASTGGTSQPKFSDLTKTNQTSEQTQANPDHYGNGGIFVP